MKIQINGFDIEINTDEANIGIKIMDASGKELSNNTYSQTSEETDNVTDVDMPSAEDVSQEEPTTDDEAVEQAAEQENIEEPIEEEPVQNTGENFMVDFETFKKRINE
jgi:hypothetical protein